MKMFHKQAAAAALLAGLAAGAFAQPAPQAPSPGAGPRHEHRMDPAKMKERMAQRAAALKQKLALTPAQEGAWTAWTSAMQPGERKPFNREELAKLTTPERIDRMRALRAERQAQMDKRAEATKQFYAQLTPDQKKVFDSETAHFGRGGHHGHPRG
jgi:Spy/CpxP family protein refolding chaperone